MPELHDGESVEIQGSARIPYVLKNTGGIYSCSCAAWRFQSQGIERRTCKHLKKYLGEEVEIKRMGELACSHRQDADATPAKALPLLLAQSWNEAKDPSDWWISEKLDGVRCYFDGSMLRSRNGNMFHAPDWFKESLPNTPLDGELWLNRKMFQHTVSIVRRHDQCDNWKLIRYVVFDAPAVAGPFETRHAFLRATFRDHAPPFARVLEQTRCRGRTHLRDTLAAIEAIGGEGLMLRQPGSCYEPGRSPTLLKVKSFREVDVRIVEHLPGTGRHRGRLGALAVVMRNGKQFSVGSGLTDGQRDTPPPVGTIITVKFQELTDGGIPRFPTFLRVRSDLVLPSG